MQIKAILSFVFILLWGHSYSQSIYGAVAPDSIRKACDKVVINEIGQKAFDTHVKFIKSDAHTANKVLNGYTFFYSFRFPNVKESHVVFSIEYKIAPTKNGVVKDIAFKNYTRLPLSIKSKGLSIIDYEAAKKIAMEADTTLKKFSNRLYSELSTDYDTAAKDYYFVWYFYHLEPCKNCEAEMYTTHSAFINATTGKVISTGKK